MQKISDIWILLATKADTSSDLLRARIAAAQPRVGLAVKP
jgi:hypothetical protein